MQDDLLLVCLFLDCFIMPHNHKVNLFTASRVIALIVVVLLAVTVSVKSTVELAFASNRCRVGTIYQRTSCTRCVCGLLNFMLCRQTCPPSLEGFQTTHRPSGIRPTGPTIVPILFPSINGSIRLSGVQFPSNFTILQLLRPIPAK